MSSLEVTRRDRRRSTARSGTGRGFTKHTTTTLMESAPKPSLLRRAGKNAWCGSRSRLRSAVEERSSRGASKVHDLVLAKLAAGRPHDYEFVEEAIRVKLIDLEQLQLGVDLVPNSHRALVRERLERIAER